MLFLRDLIFVAEPNFWQTYAMPVLLPAFGIPIQAAFTLLLCPNHKKLILKILLVIIALANILVWAFSLVVSSITDTPFWFDTTTVELSSSVVSIITIAIILKNISSFYEAVIDE